MPLFYMKKITLLEATMALLCCTHHTTEVEVVKAITLRQYIKKPANIVWQVQIV